MRGSSSKKARAPPEGTTMSSIAADLEEAMLYTCLSNDKGEVELIGGESSHDATESNTNPKTRYALSPAGSFASLEDSSDTDSDVSLCRAHQQPHSQAIEIEQDGDCTAIWPNLLFLQDDHNLCDLHLEGTAHDGTIADRSSTTPRRKLSLHTNTAIVSQPSPLQKSALKHRNNRDKNRTKSVHFAQVKVREYSVSLSQNPSCSEGPPIELGWEFREPPPVGLDTFEEERQPLRRRLHDLILSDGARRKMLLQNYYTPQQITRAIREVEQLKRQRIMTYLMLPAAALDEAAEEIYDYWAHVFK